MVDSGRFRSTFLGARVPPQSSSKPAELHFLFCRHRLGTLLLNLIPQIQQNLNSELAPDGYGGMDPPSLFLFDIQEDQVGTLQEFLKDRGLAITGLSPMIRARLPPSTARPFEKDSRRHAPGHSRRRTRLAIQKSRIQSLIVAISFRTASRSPRAIRSPESSFTISIAHAPAESPKFLSSDAFAQRIGIQYRRHPEIRCRRNYRSRPSRESPESSMDGVSAQFLRALSARGLEDAPKTYICDDSKA